MQWKDTGGAGEGAGEGGSGEDILTRMKDRNLRDLVYLINKPPRWNEQVGAYVLNFNGRVTMASVKNFQLVDPDEQNAVVLQVRQWRGLFRVVGAMRCDLPLSSIVHTVRQSGQGRVHDGPAAPHLALPGLRRHPVLLRLQDRLRLTQKSSRHLS